MGKINYNVEITNDRGEKIGVSGADSIDEAFKYMEKAKADREHTVKAQEEEAKENASLNPPDSSDEVPSAQGPSTTAPSTTAGVPNNDEPSTTVSPEGGSIST